MLLDPVAALAAGPERVGGKAIGLARLHQVGAAVPWWFVIPVEAFAAQLDAVGRDAIATAALDPELAAQVRAALDGRDGPFAVRSSVVGEDSETQSFAGMFDSFLFLNSPDEVLAAVATCWASAFNERALAYQGATDRTPAVGVVVQECVDGDVSGVMFTSNVVAGRPDEVLISAAWGIGEGIVGGLCNTDDYVVSHSGAELSATIADKDVQVVRAAGGGTAEAVVAPEQRRLRSLPVDVVAELARQGLAVATELGAPQDLEFTVRDGEIFVLQTRPITAKPGLGEWRIVWDNSNIQESFNGVTTPLTFSFAVAAYEKVHRASLQMLRVPDTTIAEYKPVLRNMIGLVSGRVYYNINNWYRVLLLVPGFDRNKEDLERTIGVQHSVDFIEGRALSTADKLRKLPSLAGVGARLAAMLARRKSLVADFQARIPAAIADVDRRLQTAATLKDVVYLGEELLDLFDEWYVPTLNDFSMSTRSGKARRIVATVAGADAENVVAALLGAEEAVESLEPTRALMTMAKQIRSDSALLATLNAGDPASALAALRAASPSLARQIGDYLDKYGDRAIGEQKLETISLRQDPSFLTSILRNFAADPNIDPARLDVRQRERSDEFEREIMSKLGARDRRRLAAHLASARDSVKSREAMRFTRTRLLGVARAAYNEAGRRLHEAGHLDEARDVFYLTVDELHALVEGRSVTTGLAALARMRKAEFATYADAEPPNHFSTFGAPVYGRRESPEEVAAASGTTQLSGTGCCPGIAESALRVVLSPDDDLGINGRILTTMRTDPGWGPLFPSASGLLVERGSTLSHSAILARELGIPAVVGIPGLIATVRDGERARLDGATGVVRLLDRADPAAAEGAAAQPRTAASIDAP